MTVKLAHQTQKTAGIPNGMRTATIVAVSGTAVTISVSGGQFTAGVGVLTSYVPNVGDVVAVFRQDSSWLILGPTTASPVGNWVRFRDLPGGYQGGWTDRGSPYPAGQYRVTGTEVQIVGQLNNGSVPASGAIIVSGLPVPSGEVAVAVGTAGTGYCSMHVDASGNLRAYSSNASTLMTAGFLQFCGTYPLDALIG